MYSSGQSSSVEILENAETDSNFSASKLLKHFVSCRKFFEATLRFRVPLSCPSDYTWKMFAIDDLAF